MEGLNRWSSHIANEASNVSDLVTQDLNVTPQILAVTRSAEHALTLHNHSSLRLEWPFSSLAYQTVIKHLSISDQQSYCSPTWPCLARITLFLPLEVVFFNFDKLLPNLGLKEIYF